MVLGNATSAQTIIDSGAGSYCSKLLIWRLLFRTFNMYSFLTREKYHIHIHTQTQAHTHLKLKCLLHANVTIISAGKDDPSPLWCYETNT